MPEFRLRQDNMTVAATKGETAEEELMRYVDQYRQDGEVTVQVKHMLPSGPSWKRHSFFAQYPQSTIITT
jgi:hypothetical protein